MGRAFSEIISTELAAAPGITVILSAQMHAVERQTGVRPISAPGISAERPLAMLAGATEIGLGDFSVRGGKLRADLTIRNVQAGKAVKVLHVETGSGDIAGAASQLARQISAAAGSFSTTNSEAIQAYMTGLEDANISAESAQRAIAADPNFAPAYRMLAAAKVRQQDQAGALAVLADAAKRGSGMTPAERARNAVEEAALRNDAVGRRRALADLVKSVPGDMDAWRTLAELSFVGRDYGQAVTAFQKILELQPQDTEALNQLAYSYAYSGNLQAALSALQRFRELRPTDPNGLDSTGDAYLISGNPEEAGTFYLQAYQKDANFQGGGDIFKAAMAKLMSGDVAGADAIEKQGDEKHAAAHDPALPYRQAIWSWIAGRRKEAYQQMLEFAQTNENGPLKEAASGAYTQLAAWSLVLGNRAAAGEMAGKAVQQAGPKSAAVAVLMRFLTMPPASAAEWKTRADQLFRQAAGDALKDLWLTYALVLNNDFANATSTLESYRAKSIATDESLPVVHAWMLMETGKESEAAPLLRYNPPPPMTGPSLFTSLYFPRLYYLRAVLADKAGNRDEARKNYQLFLRLSGPTPLQWGEEQKAQKALAP